MIEWWMHLRHDLLKRYFSIPRIRSNLIVVSPFLNFTSLCLVSSCTCLVPLCCLSNLERSSTNFNHSCHFYCLTQLLFVYSFVEKINTFLCIVVLLVSSMLVLFPFYIRTFFQLQEKQAKPHQGDKIHQLANLTPIYVMQQRYNYSVLNNLTTLRSRNGNQLLAFGTV